MAGHDVKYGAVSAGFSEALAKTQKQVGDLSEATRKLSQIEGENTLSVRRNLEARRDWLALASQQLTRLNELGTALQREGALVAANTEAWRVNAAAREAALASRPGTAATTAAQPSVLTGQTRELAAYEEQLGRVNRARAAAFGSVVGGTAVSSGEVAATERLGQARTANVAATRAEAAESQRTVAQQNALVGAKTRYAEANERVTASLARLQAAEVELASVQARRSSIPTSARTAVGSTAREGEGGSKPTPVAPVQQVAAAEQNLQRTRQSLVATNRQLAQATREYTAAEQQAQGAAQRSATTAAAALPGGRYGGVAASIGPQGQAAPTTPVAAAPRPTSGIVAGGREATLARYRARQEAREAEAAPQPSTQTKVEVPAAAPTVVPPTPTPASSPFALQAARQRARLAALDVQEARAHEQEVLAQPRSTYLNSEEGKRNAERQAAEREEAQRRVQQAEREYAFQRNSVGQLSALQPPAANIHQRAVERVQLTSEPSAAEAERIAYQLAPQRQTGQVQKLLATRFPSISPEEQQRLYVENLEAQGRTVPTTETRGRYGQVIRSSAGEPQPIGITGNFPGGQQLSIERSAAQVAEGLKQATTGAAKEFEAAAKEAQVKLASSPRTNARALEQRLQATPAPPSDQYATKVAGILQRPAPLAAVTEREVFTPQGPSREYEQALFEQRRLKVAAEIAAQGGPSQFPGDREFNPVLASGSKLQLEHRAAVAQVERENALIHREQTRGPDESAQNRIVAAEGRREVGIQRVQELERQLATTTVQTSRQEAQAVEQSAERQVVSARQVVNATEAVIAARARLKSVLPVNGPVSELGQAGAGNINALQRSALYTPPVREAVGELQAAETELRALRLAAAEQGNLASVGGGYTVRGFGNAERSKVAAQARAVEELLPGAPQLPVTKLSRGELIRGSLGFYEHGTGEIHLPPGKALGTTALAGGGFADLGGIEGGFFRTVLTHETAHALHRRQIVPEEDVEEIGRKLRAGPRGQEIASGNVPGAPRLEDKRIKYLLRDTELYARSFTQALAEVTQQPALLEGQRGHEQLNPESTFKPGELEALGVKPILERHIAALQPSKVTASAIPAITTVPVTTELATAEEQLRQAESGRRAAEAQYTGARGQVTTARASSSRGAQTGAATEVLSAEEVAQAEQRAAAAIVLAREEVSTARALSAQRARELAAVEREIATSHYGSRIAPNIGAVFPPGGGPPGGPPYEPDFIHSSRLPVPYNPYQAFPNSTLPPASYTAAKVLATGPEAGLIPGPIIPERTAAQFRLAQQGLREGIGTEIGTTETARIGQLTAGEEIAQKKVALLSSELERQGAVTARVNSVIGESAAVFAQYDNSLIRHGALSTEFITSLARGEVTLKDFGASMVNTIGKFGGWAVAGAAVYGAYDAIKKLGTGAIQAQSGVAQLERSLPGGVNRSQAVEGFSKLSGELNLPVQNVASAQFYAARAFQSQPQSLAVARTALLAEKLDEVKAQEAVKTFAALSVSFGEGPKQIAQTFNELDVGQLKFNARLQQTLPAVGRAASSFASAGGTPKELNEQIIELFRATGGGGGTGGGNPATALIREPANLRRPEAAQTLREFGFRPEEVYKHVGRFNREVQELAPSLDQGELQSLAKAAGAGGALGFRYFLPLFKAGQTPLPGEVHEELSKAGASAQGDLEHKLNQADEQIKKIGTTLEQVGIKLGESGFTTAIVATANVISFAARQVSAALGPFELLGQTFSGLPKIIQAALLAAGGAGLLSRLGATERGLGYRSAIGSYGERVNLPLGGFVGAQRADVEKNLTAAARSREARFNAQAGRASQAELEHAERAGRANEQLKEFERQNPALISRIGRGERASTPEEQIQEEQYHNLVQEQNSALARTEAVAGQRKEFAARADRERRVIEIAKTGYEKPERPPERPSISEEIRARKEAQPGRGYFDVFKEVRQERREADRGTFYPVGEERRRRLAELTPAYETERATGIRPGPVIPPYTQADVAAAREQTARFADSAERDLTEIGQSISQAAQRVRDAALRAEGIGDAATGPVRAPLTAGQRGGEEPPPIQRGLVPSVGGLLGSAGKDAADKIAQSGLKTRFEQYGKNLFGAVNTTLIAAVTASFAGEIVGGGIGHALTQAAPGLGLGAGLGSLLGFKGAGLGAFAAGGAFLAQALAPKGAESGRLSALEKATYTASEDVEAIPLIGGVFSGILGGSAKKDREESEAAYKREEQDEAAKKRKALIAKAKTEAHRIFGKRKVSAGPTEQESAFFYGEAEAEEFEQVAEEGGRGTDAAKKYGEQTKQLEDLVKAVGPGYSSQYYRRRLESSSGVGYRQLKLHPQEAALIFQSSQQGLATAVGSIKEEFEIGLNESTDEQQRQKTLEHAHAEVQEAYQQHVGLPKRRIEQKASAAQANLANLQASFGEEGESLTPQARSILQGLLPELKTRRDSSGTAQDYERVKSVEESLKTGTLGKGAVEALEKKQGEYAKELEEAKTKLSGQNEAVKKTTYLLQQVNSELDAVSFKRFAAELQSTTGLKLAEAGNKPRAKREIEEGSSDTLEARIKEELTHNISQADREQKDAQLRTIKEQRIARSETKEKEGVEGVKVRETIRLSKLSLNQPVGEAEIKLRAAEETAARTHGKAFTPHEEAEARANVPLAARTVEQAKLQEERQLVTARASLEEAQAPIGNPVLQAEVKLHAQQRIFAVAKNNKNYNQAEKIEAQANAVGAQRALEETRLSQATQLAQLGGQIAVARKPGNVVADAQAQLAAAKQVAALARGPVAQAQAQLGIIEAENAIRQAYQQRIDTAVEYADSLKTTNPLAQLGRQLRGAREKLKYAKGPEEKEKAKADINNKLAAKREFERGEREEVIQQKVEFGEETPGEAFEQYQKILSHPKRYNLTPQRKRQIKSAEFQLLNNATREFAVGSVVEGPTLYTALTLTPRLPSAAATQAAIRTGPPKPALAHAAESKAPVHLIQHNNVTINVTGAGHPKEVAERVAGHFERTFHTHTRAHLRSAGLHG